MQFKNKTYSGFLVLAGFLVCSTSIFAQRNLHIALKGGILRGQESVKSENISSFDIGSTGEDLNNNFSVGVSLPLKNRFRIGGELGLITYKTFFAYKFVYKIGTEELLYGRYDINQVFLAVTPEYRILPWAYLNGGLGLYYDYKSAFANGTRKSNGVSTNITALKYKRAIPFGYFVGLGVCPSITKELSLLGEVRFTGSPTSISSPDKIAVSYRALNFNVGLVFKFATK